MEGEMDVPVDVFQALTYKLIEVFPSVHDELLDSLMSQWFAWDQNAQTRGELKKIAENHGSNGISPRMRTRLEFGTAGIRGRMGAGYACMNDLVVIQTTQGVLSYVDKCVPNAFMRGVVVGYDGRRNSYRFAQLTALAFKNRGYTVYFFSKVCPTPFVPFAVAFYNCAVGIMITASHNPKEDNGYKVYWGNGAQIVSPHDKMIQAAIMKNQIPWYNAWRIETLRIGGLNDPLSEMMSEYYKKMVGDHALSHDINKRCPLVFTYTPMHGVGFNYMKEAFRSSGFKPFVSVTEQQDPHQEFPTVKFPNPEEGKSALNLAIQTANFAKSTIILANDPDADRLAVAEKQPTGEWKIFNGNELGALLGWWALDWHKRHASEPLSDCYMIASTVSSKFLKTMADAEGFNYLETLTGFKWMGNRAYALQKESKKVLFAFEEAIGFMFGTAVLDKDGISAGARMAELAAYLQTKGLTLNGQLTKLYEMYGFHISRNSYFICDKPEVIKNLFNDIRTFRKTGTNKMDFYPNSIINGKYKINWIRDLTTGFDSSTPDNVPVLPVSSGSQMITFGFENGTVVTLRTSGTEPKIKYYMELRTPPEDRDWRSAEDVLEEMLLGIIGEWFRPIHFDLQYRPEDSHFRVRLARSNGHCANGT